MPFIILYIIKLSVSLAIFYLFYFLVLRKLTFYNWNRWYLLGYTLLSFFIPFINISPVLDKYEMGGSESISWVPVIGNNKETLNNTLQTSATITTWQVLILIIVGGMLILLIRLLVQYLSYCRLLKNADILSKGDINFYRIHDSIAPFSFGQSIFMNPALHTKDELEEIIKHEMVHVKQRHTIDIIWGELLCMLNWVNPFAWLIRKAIRQNLEFIADRKVLEHGFDKTDYQYLLLKVVGNNRFSITHQFNFSSLKKRIAMMNKLKTAKKHLVKFLFIIPLIALMLVAFRNRSTNSSNLKIVGFTIEEGSHFKIGKVDIRILETGQLCKSDENGYYEIEIPQRAEKNKYLNLVFEKEGYKTFSSKMNITFDRQKNKGFLQLVSLNQFKGYKQSNLFVSKNSGLETPNFLNASKMYNEMVLFLKEYYKSATIPPTDTTILPEGLSNEDLKDPVMRYSVNRKDSTLAFTRKSGKTGKYLFKSNEEKIDFFNRLSKDEKVDEEKSVPLSPKDYTDFFRNNPEIKDVSWNRNPYRITIALDNGKKETYILNNKEEVARAEKKYGKLPVGPPPPPLPPPPPPPKEPDEANSGKPDLN